MGLTGKQTKNGDGDGDGDGDGEGEGDDPRTMVKWDRPELISGVSERETDEEW